MPATSRKGERGTARWSGVAPGSPSKSIRTQPAVVRRTWPRCRSPWIWWIGTGVVMPRTSSKAARSSDSSGASAGTSASTTSRRACMASTSAASPAAPTNVWPVADARAAWTSATAVPSRVASPAKSPPTSSACRSPSASRSRTLAVAIAQPSTASGRNRCMKPSTTGRHARRSARRAAWRCAGCRPVPGAGPRPGCCPAPAAGTASGCPARTPATCCSARPPSVAAGRPARPAGPPRTAAPPTEPCDSNRSSSVAIRSGSCGASYTVRPPSEPITACARWSGTLVRTPNSSWYGSPPSTDTIACTSAGSPSTSTADRTRPRRTSAPGPWCGRTAGRPATVTTCPRGPRPVR